MKTRENLYRKYANAVGTGAGLGRGGTEVGRDVFKYMVGRLNFDIDKLGKSNIYV